MRLFLTFAALCATLFMGVAHAHPDHPANVPPWQAATDWPDRIITTFEGDPGTSFAVTWRTDSSVGRTIAQISLATADTRFDLAAETIRADTEQVDLETMVTEGGVRDSLENIGLGPTHYHSIVFKDLEPDTLYAWRVQGARGHWSEWFQTRTAARDGPVTFVYFGDAQNGVYSHWSRVIRMAQQVAPDADFFLHAGDLVQKGDSDHNWAEWFHAGGFIHARVPSIPVPGNHENMSVWPDGPDGPRSRVRTTLWRPQFTLPIERDLPATLHESAYDVRYSDDLHIFVVDSARTSFEEQAAWLDAALAASDARWKVVSMHHPYFAPAAFDRDDTDALRRQTFAPIIERHGVDLVLTGHIHTYLRSSLRGNRGRHAARTIAGEPFDVKTVFVISASGAKSTDIYGAFPIAEMVGDSQADLDELAIERAAGNTPMFQVLRIDGDVLRYEARDATGALYDSFTIAKDAQGTKQLANGEAAYGDTRLFSNTGPYREWYDLR